jgi:hypothetical protein
VCGERLLLGFGDGPVELGAGVGDGIVVGHGGAAGEGSVVVSVTELCFVPSRGAFRSFAGPMLRLTVSTTN